MQLNWERCRRRGTSGGGLPDELGLLELLLLRAARSAEGRCRNAPCGRAKGFGGSWPGFWHDAACWPCRCALEEGWVWLLLLLAVRRKRGGDLRAAPGWK